MIRFPLLDRNDRFQERTNPMDLDDLGKSVEECKHNFDTHVVGRASYNETIDSNGSSYLNS